MTVIKILPHPPDPLGGVKNIYPHAFLKKRQNIAIASVRLSVRHAISS